MGHLGRRESWRKLIGKLEAQIKEEVMCIALSVELDVVCTLVSIH